MAFAINLALLVLGTAGTLAAFGGETWRKADGPLYKRITKRGWFALCCMMATFALGISKEVRSNRASVEAWAPDRIYLPPARASGSGVWPSDGR